MELGQILSATREALDDTTPPFLYGDEELIRYLNNAVNEVAIRTRCLMDDSGAAARIATVPDQARYDVAPEVLVVRAAHITGRKNPLIRTTAAQLDRLHPGWSHEPDTTLTQRAPEYVLFDPQQRTLILYPAPREAGTLYLRVWRLPYETERMEAPDDEPAVVLPDPESLKHWALHEAYLKKDSELYDPQRAGQHEEIFERRFGTRPTAHDLLLWSTQPTTGPRRMQPDF